jgi:hypothetical protein
LWEVIEASEDVVGLLLGRFRVASLSPRSANDIMTLVAPNKAERHHLHDVSSKADSSAKDGHANGKLELKLDEA